MVMYVAVPSSQPHSITQSYDKIKNSMHPYFQYINIEIDTFIVDTFTRFSLFELISALSVCPCVCVYVYACVCSQTHAYTYTHTCTSIGVCSFSTYLYGEDTQSEF